MFKSKKELIEKSEDLVKKNIDTKKILPKASLIIIGVLIGVLITCLYVQKYGIPFNLVSNIDSKANEERILKEIVGKVGKLIVLPKDEIPVTATITDANALIQKEPFYNGSENGDIVLMYQKALKAIIYSPSRNIIVNVGPVYMPQEGQGNDATLAGTKATSSATTVQKKK